ncbi:ABC transporter permease subunit [Actinoplanes sp. NPDC048967]|uniref:ABC transporter permease subunit n=1 Tax=Actinoplanes sp. NPDC048967 TaxID=3155269 RepID=UPI003401A279
MFLRDVYSKALWDARRSLPGWTVAIAAVALMYAAFWPTVNSPQMHDALAAYPDDVLAAFNSGDLGTAQGYLGGAVYGLLVPLLVAVFMIAAGARAVAGDEEAGTLDLVMAHPVSRRGLALRRLGAALTGMAVVAVVLFALMVALRAPFQLETVAVGGFLAMNVQLALFGTMFGTLAFAVGAATGNKSLALGVSAGVAVLAYLANSVFPQVAALEWTRNVSPFHWYLGGEPLTNGVQWGGAAALAGTAVVLAAVGVFRFGRRDIGG